MRGTDIKYELTFEVCFCAKILSVQFCLALRMTINELLYNFCCGMFNMRWLFIKSVLMKLADRETPTKRH